MKHRHYLAALPAMLTRAAAADAVGTRRATALTRRLEDAAVQLRAACWLGLLRLDHLALAAVAALVAVAVLALTIALEIARKGVSL